MIGYLAPMSRPTRDSFRGHGRPARACWFDNGREATGDGRVVDFQPAGARIHVLDARTGEQVATVGTSTKMWLAPAVEVSPEAVAAARMDALHTEALRANWLYWATSGRNHEPGIELTHSHMRVEQQVAAQLGRGVLALAIGRRLAELEPAYTAARAEAERQMAEQRARVARQRAAAAEREQRAEADRAAALERAEMEQAERRARIIAERATEAAPGEVVIVACGGRKLDRPAPAGDLYTGSYHAACRRAAAARGGRVFILSALHGLLPLDRVVAPYEQRMGAPGAITARQVRDQAVALGIAGASRVTVLAGRAYAELARKVWPAIEWPLDGTGGIGEQLARLKGIAETPRPPRPPRSREPLWMVRARRAEAAGQLSLFAGAA